MKAEYPQIDLVSFWEITVVGKTYGHDIYIRVDGKVKKRDKKLAKGLYGSSHVIGPEELKRVCKGNPETLFVGTGMSGLAELNDQAGQYLTERSIRCEVLTTREAVKAYNESRQSKAVLIHVTC